MRIVGLRHSSARSCRVLVRATVVLSRRATSLLSAAKHSEMLSNLDPSNRSSLSVKDSVPHWYTSCDLVADGIPAMADSRKLTITCPFVLGALDALNTGGAFVFLRFATPSTNRICLPTPLHSMFFLTHLAHFGVPASHCIRRRTHWRQLSSRIAQWRVS